MQINTHACVCDRTVVKFNVTRNNIMYISHGVIYVGNTQYNFHSW